MSKRIPGVADELHAPARRNFERTKIFVYNVDEIWTMDLVDMPNFVEENDGYRYILTCMDIGSRYAWAVPMKDKSAKTTVEAIKSIVADNKGTIAPKIWVDQGSEFFNKTVIQYLKSLKSELYHTYSEKKAVFIERFNRTLKSRMFKRFTEEQSFRWIDDLPQLVKEYNETLHSSILARPADVKSGEKIIDHPIEQIGPYEPLKFKVGDRVRISRLKGIFEKGYTPNWSYETFLIRKAKLGHPNTYLLKDEMNEDVDGWFYELELQPAKQQEFYHIEKVLQEKYNRKTKQKEYLVKWLGYPEKFNSWVQEADLKK